MAGRSLHRSTRGAGALEAAYGVACLIAAASLAWSLRDAASPWLWAVLWCGGVAALAFTPRRPVLPLVVYIVCAYGVPRAEKLTQDPWRAGGEMANYAHSYSQAYGDLLTHGVLHWIAGLGVVGVALWLRRERRPLAPLVRSPVLWLLVLWVAWVGVACVASVLRGEPWQPLSHRHPSAFGDALAMAFIAACVLGDDQIRRAPGATAVPAVHGSPRSTAGTAVARDAQHSTRRQIAFIAAAVAAPLVLSLAVIALRGVGEGRGIDRDADIAALLVIALPLALLGAALVRATPGRIAFYIASGCIVALLVLTRNRGAAVAFAATLPMLWLVSRRKWRNLAIGLPVLIAAVIALRFTPLWDRFAGIWSGGGDVATVQQRFDTWRGGLRMAADHAVFGVGPGNGHRFAHAYYADADPGFVAHNNLLHVAGETGFVGAALYVALFIAAFIVLIRVAWRRGHDASGVAARMLIATLVAYHVVGLFISRHDLVLAYVLVGWAAGVGMKATKRQSNRTTNLRRRPSA